LARHVEEVKDGVIVREALLNLMYSRGVEHTVIGSSRTGN
jgi:hypothetical protein